MYKTIPMIDRVQRLVQENVTDDELEGLFNELLSRGEMKMHQGPSDFVETPETYISFNSGKERFYIGELAYTSELGLHIAPVRTYKCNECGRTRTVRSLEIEDSLKCKPMILSREGCKTGTMHFEK